MCMCARMHAALMYSYISTLWCVSVTSGFHAQKIFLFPQLRTEASASLILICTRTHMHAYTHTWTVAHEFSRDVCAGAF
jgi:hypothetical protein